MPLHSDFLAFKIETGYFGAFGLIVMCKHVFPYNSKSKGNLVAKEVY
jgi:hypothetical protein